MPRGKKMTLNTKVILPNSDYNSKCWQIHVQQKFLKSKKHQHHWVETICLEEWTIIAQSQCVGLLKSHKKFGLLFKLSLFGFFFFLGLGWCSNYISILYTNIQKILAVTLNVSFSWFNLVALYIRLFYFEACHIYVYIFMLVNGFPKQYTWVST